MEKSVRIVTFLLVLILSFCILLTSCGKQEKFEEAYIAGMENVIEEFKTENSGKILSVTYNITSFDGMDEANVVFHIKSSGEITNASYVDLFYPNIDFKKNGIPVYTSTYGDVYINGKLEYSKNKPTCKFKNSDGEMICNNKPTKGELCEYHFNMLDDIYNDLVN